MARSTFRQATLTGGSETGIIGAMTRERTNSGAAVTASVVVLLLVAMPVLYVLSLGPAALLHKHGYLEKPIEVICSPLEILAESNEPVRNVLDSYVRLWSP